MSEHDEASVTHTAQDHNGSIKELEARLSAIEQRIETLEATSTNRGRAMFLSVIAIYAVLAALVVLHWAGHFVRDGS